MAIAGCGDVLFGSCAGLAHLLPFALVLIALLSGRYPGEDRLARLARTRVTQPRDQVIRSRVPIRYAPHLLPRGGRLIASFLAVRPPPRATA